jgi:hypothetical protein
MSDFIKISNQSYVVACPRHENIVTGWMQVS